MALQIAGDSQYPRMLRQQPMAIEASMRHIRRNWLALGLVGLAGVAAAQTADEQLRALYQREWDWRLHELPQLATSVGVHDYDDRLGIVDEKSQLARMRYWQGVLKDLDAIDRNALAPVARIDFAVYRDQVRNFAEDIRLGFYLMPLNSDSAFYSDLTFLPQTHPFASVGDYDNYLKRLAQVPQYFAEHIVLLRTGIKRGMTVPKVVLQGRDQPIRDAAALKSPEDSLFYAPFKQFPASVAQSDRERLARAGARAIAESVTPAYARLLKFYDDEYLPHARTTIAATALPDGKAFYRQAIREYTTLDLAPEAIHRTGVDEVARIHAEMEQVMRAAKFDGSFPEFLKFLRSDPQFYARTPEELLMHASWIAKRIDGQLPKFFGLLPRLPYGVAPVPAEIAPFYTGGRYVPAAEGSHESGTYWVNTYDLKSRPLYTQPSLTLHEAVPGHHLQGALASEQGEQPPFRRFSYISAYGEGWALYAEHLGVEMGIYTTPYEQFGRLTYEMWRACRLVVDTGMHALGWTREQAIAFLRDNTALSEHEIDTEFDRYISWRGQALSYKLGELKIRELRAQAEQQLGPKFDLRAFHDAVLATGSVPLPVLEERIHAFIATANAK